MKKQKRSYEKALGGMAGFLDRMRDANRKKQSRKSFDRSKPPRGGFRN